MTAWRRTKWTDFSLKGGFVWFRPDEKVDSVCVYSDENALQASRIEQNRVKNSRFVKRKAALANSPEGIE